MKREIYLIGLVFNIYFSTGSSFGQFTLSTNDVGGFDFKNYEEPTPVIKRNYLNVDLWEIVFGLSEISGRHQNRLHLSYERLSNTGETGFNAEILLVKSLGLKEYNYPASWEGNWFLPGGVLHFSYLPFNSFVKAGINYYPFNYTLNHISKARFLSGISLLLGDINRSDFSVDPYPYIENVFVAFLISNIDIKLYLSRSIQFKAGIDMSILPFLVFIAPEAGFSISF